MSSDFEPKYPTDSIDQLETESVWQEEDNPNNNRPGMLRTVLEFVIALAIALALTWLIKAFLIEPFEVPSGSMEATIMTNDKILADKVSYHFSDIQRGEIIVFADKGSEDRILVKRVIATGGQTVDIQNGLVYVDGSPLYEPYTRESKTLPLIQHLNNMAIDYPYRIPKDQLWVMGDNRENSADSRYFGTIPTSSVYGKAVMVFWPIEHIGPLASQYNLSGEPE
jgi:signal peptidase I